MPETIASNWHTVAALWPDRHRPFERRRIRACLLRIAELDPARKAEVDLRLRHLDAAERDRTIVELPGGGRPPSPGPVPPKGPQPETAGSVDCPYLVARDTVPSVRWEDIGGIADAVDAVRAAVEVPLLHPEVREYFKMRSGGTLLTGKPGCGKTLLAEAVVSNVPNLNFYSVRGSELLSKYLGQSEQDLNNLFRHARAHAPALIFFDELDALGAARGDNTDADRVLSTFLTCLDGMGRRDGVAVLAATNRPDALDPALRRPGRFEQEIEIPYPDAQGRRQIWRIHATKRPLADDIDEDAWVQLTEGLGGAHIAGIFDLATRDLLRENLWMLEDPNPVPPERLGEMRIRHRHLVGALRAVREQLGSSQEVAS